MAHIYAIDKLLSGGGIPDRAKVIAKKMYELDIPVLLGSDAHKIDEIAYEFKYIIDLLKNIGYNQLAHYNKRRRTFIEID